MSIHTLIKEWQQIGLISWLQNPYGWLTEEGKPLSLTPWQCALLTEYLKRRGDVSTLLISSVKKSGKTTLNSGLVAYRWLTLPNSLHFAVANDQSQAEELQFNQIAAMVKRHPILKRHTRITKDTLTFEPTGSRILSLPMDAPGAAGANFATVSFSELWGYVYEAGQRLYEELTPIPLTDCLRIVDSYAGFTGESELLQRVWDRGLEGEPVNDEWPIYLSGQQLSYIHSGEDAQERCWRGTEAARLAYYEEQRATLRPNTFNRLHLNSWVSGSGSFCEPAAWAACLDSDHRPLLPNKEKPLFIGLDLATAAGGDNAALVGVYAEGGLTKLALHKVWRGSDRKKIKGATEGQDRLKLKQTVFPYLLQVKRNYNLKGVWFDVYQALSLAEDLRKEGIRCIEVSQTHAGRGPKDTELLEMVNNRGLVLYDHPDTKNASAGANARELGNGQIFIKKAARLKIDFLVALSNCASEARRPRGWARGSA